MKKLYTITILFFLFYSAGFAQGTIKGKLTDTSGKHPLGLATVTVFKAADTSLITYRLSNPEGEFKVPGLPLNLLCRVVISYSGYDAYRKEFMLTDETPLDLGTVPMQSVSKTLDEVLVIAERPPVTVKQDTIEFNAASFRTLPTSLVEDLLRKLPGVQVDREGNITANGRKVNRIMVDGKAFFGDDPKMATRNLPANVIDKIQVTDDKDEAARSTDGDLTNVGQVINLTLKKGVKKGWFGKAYAGMGTKDRYEAGGIFNIYRDTMQLSLIGFSNNVNRSGFSFQEVQNLGGFNRSGMNQMMMSNRGGQTGFAINGVSFGGLDAGISRTSGAGFNLNHAPNKKNSLFLQYFFGNTDGDIRQINNNQQFFNDTVVNNRTTTVNNRVIYSHNISAGANLKPDTLTDLNFRAGYSLSLTDENINATVQLNNNKRGDISRGAGNQFNDFTSKRYNHSLFLTRRFKAKKGRTLNLNHFANINNNRNDYITESINEFFVPVPRQQIFNQLRSQEMPYLSLNTSATFAEPLSKKLTARVTGRYDYLRDQQDIGIFDKDIVNGKYELINYSQSTGFVRKQHRSSMYGGLSYKINKITLNAGISGLWQDINNQFKNIATPVNFHLFNILPSASLQWKQLSANYQMNVSAPQSNFLVPLPDSSNPFMVRVGNPYLRPAKQHQFFLNNFNFFQGSGASVNVFANATFINDDVVMKRTVNANGTQVDSAVNANGTVNFSANIGFGKEFKNKQKFIFSFRISPYINFNRRVLIVNNNVGTGTTISYGPTINVGLNWNDKVEFRPMYSPNISKTRYSDPAFTNLHVVNHYAEGELIVRWPKKLVWETNVAYRYTSQVAPGLPKDNVLWNAAVTFLMLKDDRGMLKLSVFDLLNRNNGLFRFASQNQIVDQQTNVLQRYAMLTFTYNIRNIGMPKKVGGKDRLFMF